MHTQFLDQKNSEIEALRVEYSQKTCQMELKCHNLENKGIITCIRLYIYTACVNCSDTIGKATQYQERRTKQRVTEDQRGI